MYGSINKRQMTKEAIQEEPLIKEVYVDKDFDWSNDKAVVYIRHSRLFSPVRILFKLNSIWGYGNCKVYATTAFDSLLLDDKRLIYTTGKWVGA